jgi:hypothetical protein
MKARIRRWLGVADQNHDHRRSEWLHVLEVEFDNVTLSFPVDPWERRGHVRVQGTVEISRERVA